MSSWDRLLGFSLASCFKDLKMNATSNGLGFIRAIGAGKGWSGSSAWRLDTPKNRIVLRDQWGQDCLIEGMTVASLDDQRKILAKAEGLLS